MLTQYSRPEIWNRHRLGNLFLWGAGIVILGVLLWVAVHNRGVVPDPTIEHLSRGAAILDSGILVFREGLEVILVLAAVTASMVGKVPYRGPVALGSGLAFLASVGTWFIAVAVIGVVKAPELEIQAVTGLLAVVVLLIVMNWFFHKVYWTAWISHHRKRQQKLIEEDATGSSSRTTLGLALLGFTAMYREGFEVVLFLQNLRLQVGVGAVLLGTSIGLILTLLVGILTFVAHRRLPYKKMLIFTGVMLAGVLVVMVGESVQELQQAGWLATTPLPLPIPDWAGLWFAISPNVESLTAQLLALGAVLGSYFFSQWMKVWRPLRKSKASLAS